MSDNTKTWQERADEASRNNEHVEWPQIYMKAEIAELRAARAAAQAKITELEVAGCTDSYALQSAIAAQAPSAPVARDLSAEFEAWAKNEGLIQESFGIRSEWSGCVVAKRAFDAGAALSVKAASTPEIPEDWKAQREQLRAQYPGIDGEFKVFDVVITTELDCKLDEGEYGIDICELVNGCVGEHDFGRIEDAVSEVIDTLNLPDEGQTVIRVYESGEREDVFWNSYWRVAAPTPPTTGEA